jgi:hypothetical protein
MQHANQAIDEVRRAEFYRKGGAMRNVVKGKRWLLLTRWVHLNSDKRQQLNHLFSLNRKVMKAYLLKESLERLWTYTYEGAMLRYLKSWTLQLRWQRLPAFEKLAHMLIDHVDGILNHCRTKVRFGVVEASNGNIKSLLRRGRGYKNLRYLLLKAQRMAVTKTEFVVFRKAATLGQRMQRVSRANLSDPNRTLSDPNVPRTITEDDFFGEVRKCVWDCLEQLVDTATMGPHQRLALLRRRLWMRGRRVELITKACVVDRAELLRIIAEGERRLRKASTGRT